MMEVASPTYYLGQPRTFFVQLTQPDANGTPQFVDPTNPPQLKLVDPTGAPTLLTATRTTTGHWQIAFAPQVAGAWVGKWTSDLSGGVAPGLGIFRFFVVDPGV